MKTNETSWGKVANWYDDLLEKEGNYQKDVILPNLLLAMDIGTDEKILDLACGQGFFAREFYKAGANVLGADIGEELIKIAREKSPKVINFTVSPADNLSFLEDASVDKISIVLAIQNIENLSGTIKECARVLKPAGKLFLVLNHPAFRVPKESSWGFDDKRGVQYRRVDQYLTESKISIKMNPGKKDSVNTVSFHRPLQTYIKALKNGGLCVSNLEEWISNRESQPGLRSKGENKSRKEIPLFMLLEAQK